MKNVAVLISTLIVLLVTTVVATPTYWRQLQPGIEYAKLTRLSGFHLGYVHAFRIDLTHNRLQLAIAEDHRDKIATVADLAEQDQAIIGINGGFFSQELRPLGLRISDYRQRNPLKSTPWWGIFYVLNQQPSIISRNQFRPSNQIQFAIQSGPRLLIKGKIPTLKGGVDTRTALGTTPDGKVVIAVTDHLMLTTAALARVMASHLGCDYALNLDGGSSSQLYVNTGKFKLAVPGLSAVTDAVLVIPK